MHFHLLKFTGSKDEVSWSNLIAEGFTNLGDPEGDLLARGINYIGKVYKDPLGSFWTKIYG